MKGYLFWLKRNWRFEQVAFLEMEESHSMCKNSGWSQEKKWIYQQGKLVFFFPVFFSSKL